MLNNFRVTTRIYAGFAATILLGVGLACFSVLQISAVRSQVDALAVIFGAALRAGDSATDLAEIRRLETAYRLAADPALLGEAVALANQVQSRLDESVRLSLSEERRRIYREIVAALPAHLATLENFKQASEAAAAARARLITGGLTLAAATKGISGAAGGSSGADHAAAEALIDAIMQVRVSNMRFQVAGDQKAREAFGPQAEQAVAALAGFAKVATTAELPLIEPLRAELASYVDAFGRLAQADQKAKAIFQSELQPQIADLQKRLHEGQVGSRALFDQRNAAMHQTMSQTTTLQAGLAMFGLVLGATLAVMVGRSIAVPLTRLTEVMRRLAQGDTSVHIPGRAKGHELGEMARAVDVFKQNAVAIAGARAEQEAEAAAKERRTQRVDSLIRGFEAKAGDLSRGFAAASAELEGTAQTMSATASHTNRQATQVAASADDASRGLQTVATSAEELAASIGEINRQVTQSARTTDKTAESARRVNSTVQSLAEAAQKIGDVVGLITNVAGQTNLLALNATIEAARAGDAGKGFAVVASEVKSLAAQTAKATDEISAQITQIQGVTAEVVEAIRGIVEMIEQAATISTTIASAVEEQGAATAEISRSVGLTAASAQLVKENIAGVSQAANDTGAAAGQVLGSASTLSRQAAQLSREVSAFLSEVRAA